MSANKFQIEVPPDTDKWCNSAVNRPISMTTEQTDEDQEIWLKTWDKASEPISSRDYFVKKKKPTLVCSNTT